jgi:hypothetical protein
MGIGADKKEEEKATTLEQMMQVYIVAQGLIQ